MRKVIMVVPCFNEEHRFREEEMAALANYPGVRLVLVDDGSTDRTQAVLERAKERSEGRIEVLALGKNQGKAEAVRRGLLRALEDDPAIAGYLDADLATPVDEILRLIHELDALDADVVLGARVALLGLTIERKNARHYM